MPSRSLISPLPHSNSTRIPNPSPQLPRLHTRTPFHAASAPSLAQLPHHPAGPPSDHAPARPHTPRRQHRVVQYADVVLDHDHVADGTVGADADVGADRGGVDVRVGADEDEVGDAQGKVG